MDTLIYAGIILLGLIVVGVVIARLYRRATKERAFVRTGLGGQKVVLNGGAIVMPIFHEVLDVNLNTLKLTVSRRDENAMISSDKLRVNATAEFYLRVKPDADSVATAAQTLAQRTLNPDGLKDLIEGKLVDGLRSVAASMTMDDMHEKRAEFVQAVQQTVANDLTTNGLELESVSLTDLDQTDLRFFNDSNAFDAVGRAKIVGIAKRRNRSCASVRRSSSQNWPSSARSRPSVQARKQISPSAGPSRSANRRRSASRPNSILSARKSNPSEISKSLNRTERLPSRTSRVKKVRLELKLMKLVQRLSLQKKA